MKSTAELITPKMQSKVASEIARDWSKPSQPASPERPVKHPCETIWQRKWVKLDCWHPDVQKIATEAERFAGRWFRNRQDCEKLLVLAGHTGCGKTHCARAVYSFTARSPPTGSVVPSLAHDDGFGAFRRVLPPLPCGEDHGRKPAQLPLRVGGKGAGLRLSRALGTKRVGAQLARSA